MEENNEIHGLHVVEGDHKEDFSELEFHTTRIHELVANMIKREVYLKDEAVNRIGEILAEREVQLKNIKEELATKKEDVASIASSLDYSHKEMAELHKQNENLRAINGNNQSLIEALSRLVTEQEIQITDLKEKLVTKEKEMGVLAASLEDSKSENAELQNQVNTLKASSEQNQSLMEEYKEKNDSLSNLIANREVQLMELNEQLLASVVETTNGEQLKQVDGISATNETSQSLIVEGKEKVKDERKSQKKKLKQLLKKNPTAKEEELAEQLGVESSYIIDLRKEFGL